MPDKNVSNQMLCAIGENLVSAHLIANGWPTSNVNHSINNFKGIDLYCQKGIDNSEVIGIQMKTSTKDSFPTGFSCGQSINLNLLQQKIVGPWIFVHVQSLVPLKTDFYIIPRKAVIDIIYQSHNWYLNQWNRPAT